MEDQKAIGIDVGGTNIKAALVEGGSSVLNAIERETPKNIKDFAETITEIVGDLSPKEIVPVGIAIPGLINYQEQKIISCPNLPYLDRLKIELGNSADIRIGNDADMALLGEIEIENLYHKNILYLALGTGTGSSFYVNGLGSWQIPLSAEIGHIKVEENGRACSCGGHGCLEEYFSAKALVFQAKKRINKKIDTAEKYFEIIPTNKEARKILDEAVSYLGLGIANAINILGTETIILGGKIAKSYHLFSDKLNQSVKRNTFAVDYRNIKISKSNSIDKAAQIGAAKMTKEKQ